MKKTDYTAAYATCQTPAQIEQVFQRLIKIDPESEHYRERWAGNARAAEIATAGRWGHLLPIRLDKGQGCSQRWRIGDETYKTGHWGNGGGYRWCMADRDAWVKRKFAEGGVPAKRIDLAVRWLAAGYRWRTLRELWK